MSKMFCSYVLPFSLKTIIFGLLFSILYFNVGQCNVKAYIVKILRDSGNKSTHMEGRIVRGAPVDIERYPWSVLVFNSGALCAGTILNVLSILSAAHCFTHNNKTGDISVHVGSRFLYDHNALIHSVNRIDGHEEYNKETPFSCDIALIFLNKPIDYSKRAQKADLIDNDRWMNKKKQGFTVTGWGVIKHNGPLSEHGLLMATLNYITSTECSVMHNLKLTADMFCLYGHAHMDSCSGDSGGGVLWNGYVVGIVSHGDGCSNRDKPSVYTNVWFFRKWITDKIIAYLHYFNSKHTNVAKVQAEICEAIHCKSLYKNDTTSSPQNNNRLIKVAPYLHQFDKSVHKVRQKIIKLIKATHNKQNKKCVKYSEDKLVIDKLIQHEEKALHSNDRLIDDIDKLVAKNKYIKLKITA